MMGRTSVTEAEHTLSQIKCHILIHPILVQDKCYVSSSTHLALGVTGNEANSIFLRMQDGDRHRQQSR